MQEMEKLRKLIEESAVKLLMVSTEDLSGLADLHSQFEEIYKTVGQLQPIGQNHAEYQIGANAGALH